MKGLMILTVIFEVQIYLIQKKASIRLNAIIVHPYFPCVCSCTANITSAMFKQTKPHLT